MSQTHPFPFNLSSIKLTRMKRCSNTEISNNLKLQILKNYKLRTINFFIIEIQMHLKTLILFRNLISKMKQSEKLNVSKRLKPYEKWRIWDIMYNYQTHAKTRLMALQRLNGFSASLHSLHFWKQLSLSWIRGWVC